jgi:hypothetical protein
MNSSLEIVLAVTDPVAPGAAAISLTDALLVLSLAGLLVAAYQLNRVLQRLEAIERRLETSRAQPAPVLAAAPPGRGDHEPLPPDVLAAIVAACHVQVGGRVRIVSIADAADSKQVWSLEGRRQIFASHRPR